MLSLRVALLLVSTLSALVAVSKADCPDPEYLELLGCKCDANVHVRCRDVNSDKRLRLIMTACEGSRLKEFVLANATLDWLPDNLFHFINTEEFVLSYSTLKSLTKPMDGTHLFMGSGINTLVIDYTDVQDKDLSQLRNLDQLMNLAIRGYPHPLPVRSIALLLGGGNLQTLFLDNIPNAQWSKGALRPFERLRLISLAGLGLKQVSRDNLPELVGDLEDLWLKNNELTSFPTRFLDGMNRLRTLDLSNNRIATLDEATFSNFNGFIALHGNPLRCDSNLEWLQRRLQEGSLKLLFGQKIYCDDGTPLVNDI